MQCLFTGVRVGMEGCLVRSNAALARTYICMVRGSTYVYFEPRRHAQSRTVYLLDLTPCAVERSSSLHLCLRCA